VAQAAKDQGLGEGVRTIARQMSPSEINPKLEEAVQNQPLLEQLLSFKILGKAVAIAVVVALVLFVLLSPIIAGLGLLVAFFTSWLVLATHAVDKARPVKSKRDDASSDDSE
jgi:Flp pilus assembly protein TadB